MTADLHEYSDEALLAEVARRLRLSTPTSVAVNDARKAVVTLGSGVPTVEIPDGLASLQHDSEAIRRLLEANGQRIGLRRCEIAEAFRKAGRRALNIDQKIQYLIGRNELVGQIGPAGRTYWRLAGTG